MPNYVVFLVLIVPVLLLTRFHRKGSWYQSVILSVIKRIAEIRLPRSSADVYYGSPHLTYSMYFSAGVDVTKLQTLRGFSVLFFLIKNDS